MNNKPNKEIKIDGHSLTTIPNSFYINLDVYNNIVIRINNNEIKVDKNKLEALLRSLEKEDVYGL